MSERVQAAAVAVFLLIIAGIVVVLLSRVDRDAPAAAPTSEGGDDAESATLDPVGFLSISAGQGDLVVRIVSGSCTEAGGPKLELSENRGRTFHDVRVPQIDDGTGVSASSPAVRAIVFAEATSATRMTVAGADAECTVRRYTTADAGVTWTQESGAVEEWYLDPGNGGVVSPAGPSDSGCQGVSAIAPVSRSGATVFCSGGVVRSTRDGGDSWTEVGRLADVTAAVFTDARTGYAVVRESACKSRAHATVNGGLTWVPAGCIVEDLEMPGLADMGARLVSAGEESTRVSTDNGVTWKPPTKK